MNTSKSQKSRALRAFKSGYDFTPRQLAGRIGASTESRARYVVTELRQDGNAIYRNVKTGRNGERLSTYRLGTPSREMVKAAVLLYGSEIFNAR